MTEGQWTGTRFRKNVLYLEKYIYLLGLMFFSISAKIALEDIFPCNKVLKTTHAFFFFTKENKEKTKQNVIT